MTAQWAHEKYCARYAILQIFARSQFRIIRKFFSRITVFCEPLQVMKFSSLWSTKIVRLLNLLAHENVQDYRNWMQWLQMSTNYLWCGYASTILREHGRTSLDISHLKVSQLQTEESIDQLRNDVTWHTRIPFPTIPGSNSMWTFRSRDWLGGPLLNRL